MEFKPHEPESEMEELAQKYLDAIYTAAADGDLAAMEVTDKEGKPVMILVAAKTVHGESRLYPLARLFSTDDPSTEVNPPEGLSVKSADGTEKTIH